MHVILVPGLWLGGASWHRVVPVLERSGHRTHPLTLPGMRSVGDDRSGVTLRDHVDAVVTAIDAVDDAGAGVVLVGHSAGAAIAYAAVDARPERVQRLVCVGGRPVGDGLPIADDFPAVGSDVPLPDWSAFDDADLAGLDEAALAAFRDAAVPSPAGVVGGRQQLVDERRRHVPVTVVCCEYPADMLRGWVGDGAAPVRELAAVADVTYVDLPTGHWPMLTRPDDLARVIAASARPVVSTPVRIDEHGRTEAPYAGGEVETLLAFLDYQRTTLAWKCSGVDDDGMRATVGVSDMTLGGLLKHMAFVEDIWFSRRLAGRDPAPPWDSVDWDADPDWEWHSAAGDSPGDLSALWHEAVGRSRRCVAEALARDGLDQLAPVGRSDGVRIPSLRWILHHMIEEYARHNGHADLIRESVDGLTGE